MVGMCDFAMPLPASRQIFLGRLQDLSGTFLPYPNPNSVSSTMAAGFDEMLHNMCHPYPNPLDPRNSPPLPLQRRDATHLKIFIHPSIHGRLLNLKPSTFHTPPSSVN